MHHLHCPKYVFSKSVVKKFGNFTSNLYDIRIKWITKKVKKLFQLESKSPHPSCRIYKGTCTCKELYIDETRRKKEIKWEEHEDT